MVVLSAFMLRNTAGPTYGMSSLAFPAPSFMKSLPSFSTSSRT